MFSKGKPPQSHPAPAPAAAAAPAQKPRDRARSSVPSIISGDLIVKGTLVSNGDIQIDGRIEGDIRAGALVIGEKAHIQGDVFAEDAIVRGTVHGAIRARKVQLCSTCRVEGNILHEALAMEAGAFFEGNCRHSDNPLAEDDTPRLVAAPKPVAQPVPGAKAAAPVRANGTEPVAAAAGSRPAAAPAATFTPLKAQ
jgi:cytoskeletal protein CcmA (bactofilin family)